MKITIPMGLLAGCLIFAGSTFAVAQGNSPSIAQVVAVDECDPVTFNAAVGPDFAGTSRLEPLPRYPTYLHWRRLEPRIRAGTSNPTS
jgi:hypothetical protein